jgi:hypothetical protein
MGVQKPGKLLVGISMKIYNITITVLDIFHHPAIYVKTPGPETETRSFYLAHLCRFHLKMGTESDHQNVVFLEKEKTGQ